MGEKATCCASPDDLAGCEAEANQSCYKGDFTFKINTQSPKDMLSGGCINTGKLTLGPSNFVLVMNFSETAQLTLNLKGVMISGNITATGITNGVLAGGIPKTDVDTVLIDTIADFLDKLVKDPNTQEETKQTVLGFFDKATLPEVPDGNISADEVKNNPIIKSFLSADLDLDGDKTADALSLGVGFTAVKAVIDDK